MIENKRSGHTLLDTFLGGRICLLTIGCRDECSLSNFTSLRRSDNFVMSAPIRDAIRVYFVADFAYHRPTSHNFLE